MSKEADRLIAEWPRNRDESIRVLLTTFGRQRRIDVRIWVADADDNDRPSKKGVSLPLSDFPKLEAAIHALGQAIAEEQA